MNRIARILIPLFGLLVALILAATVHAQSIQERVARATGTVRFSYQSRPGVCGDGAATIYFENADGSRRAQVRGGGFTMSSRFADEWVTSCMAGPARAALTFESGRVTSIRVYVGGEWRARDGVTDLGRIAAPEAAAYLVRTAEQAGSSVARDAIFAATLADSNEVWRQLLTFARNAGVSIEARKQAVFWLSQEAAEAATVGLRELIDSDQEIQVREHAIFALSQRPDEESVPALITLARRHDIDPRLKKRAFFWLAQKNDPRAIAVFEEILIRDNR